MIAIPFIILAVAAAGMSWHVCRIVRRELEELRAEEEAWDTKRLQQLEKWRQGR